MNFRQKLNIRLYLAIGYIVLGLAMIVVFNIVETNNSNFLTSWGFALFVIGVVRVRNHLIITKSEERIKKQEIRETDERNIAIANKAKSVSFMVYVFLCCIAVIVLELLQMSEWTSILSGSVCVMLVIYWISYFIISKRS